jgi:hypothetical protein
MKKRIVDITDDSELLIAFAKLSKKTRVDLLSNHYGENTEVTIYTDPTLFRDILSVLKWYIDIPTLGSLKRVCRLFNQTLPKHHPRVLKLKYSLDRHIHYIGIGKDIMFSRHFYLNKLYFDLYGDNASFVIRPQYYRDGFSCTYFHDKALISNIVILKKPHLNRIATIYEDNLCDYFDPNGDCKVGKDLTKEQKQKQKKIFEFLEKIGIKF